VVEVVVRLTCKLVDSMVVSLVVVLRAPLGVSLDDDDGVGHE